MRNVPCAWWFRRIFSSRICTKRMLPGRALHLGRVLLCWRTLSRSTFRSTFRSNADVHSFCAAHHRCRRSIPAQLHPGHGEELFHRLLLRETRVETLATRPREGTVPVIRRPLRVHCSGFAPFSFPLLLPQLRPSSLPQNTLRLVIKWPSLRKRVDTEMEFARGEIDRKLLPQGEGVVRHLALPSKGCTLEWILDEMEQMDREAPKITDYRDGKLSGAVYRA